MSAIMIFKRLLSVCLLLMLGACVTIPDVTERRSQADRLASSKGWVAQKLDTGSFVLTAYRPYQFDTDDLLTIYLEGDGFAWVSRSTPSANPTPINPLALKLALADPSAGAHAYLARPCQYTQDDPGCSRRDWTGGRFSIAVVESTNRAIEQLKQASGARYLKLVGYSGGGAVAALVTARRQDVAMLVTVAGNLDHRYWTKMKRVSPLSASLNPADVWQQLADTPQVHYVGSKDTAVPPEVGRAYAARFPSAARPKIIEVPGFDHHCCWEQEWPRLVASQSAAAL